jgi:hypothetical protein
MPKAEPMVEERENLNEIYMFAGNFGDFGERSLLGERTTRRVISVHWMIAIQCSGLVCARLATSFRVVEKMSRSLMNSACFVVGRGEKGQSSSSGISSSSAAFVVAAQRLGRPWKGKNFTQMSPQD